MTYYKDQKKKQPINVPLLITTDTARVKEQVSVYSLEITAYVPCQPHFPTGLNEILYASS